jgi:hypothetical protein
MYQKQICENCLGYIYICKYICIILIAKFCCINKKLGSHDNIKITAIATLSLCRPNHCQFTAKHCNKIFICLGPLVTKTIRIR